MPLARGSDGAALSSGQHGDQLVQLGFQIGGHLAQGGLQVAPEVTKRGQRVAAGHIEQGVKEVLPFGLVASVMEVDGGLGRVRNWNV